MGVSLRFLATVFSLVSNLATTSADTFQLRSSKRGLIYIPNSAYPDDDKIWIKSTSDLTWYYNYKQGPSAIYEKSGLSFVPMLWGAPASTSDTTFLKNITAQVEGGANITYVMSFNEPDGTSATGGSNVDASTAAKVWKTQLEPLKKLNITLGAPAVTGGSAGWTWLQEFFTACDGGCSADFLPVHWYGNFDGLASHISQIETTYPNMTIWVTEFALDDSTLSDTQTFFNQSCEYLDKLSNVSYYSYFGSFRSSVSNVGPNVAFLNSKGNLTDIGSWYLGGNATGIIPDTVNTTATTTSSPKSTYSVPALVTDQSRAESGGGNWSPSKLWVFGTIFCLFLTL